MEKEFYRMRKHDWLRVKYFIYCLRHRNGYDHGMYLKKHHCFHSVGEYFFFQPWNLPADEQFIKFGSNVVVASGATFIGHDVIHNVFNHIDSAGGGTYNIRLIMM